MPVCVCLLAETLLDLCLLKDKTLSLPAASLHKTVDGVQADNGNTLAIGNGR